MVPDGISITSRSLLGYGCELWMKCSTSRNQCFARCSFLIDFLSRQGAMIALMKIADPLRRARQSVIVDTGPISSLGDVLIGMSIYMPRISIPLNNIISILPVLVAIQVAYFFSRTSCCTRTNQNRTGERISSPYRSPKTFPTPVSVSVSASADTAPTLSPSKFQPSRLALRCPKTDFGVMNTRNSAGDTHNRNKQG